MKKRIIILFVIACCMLCSCGNKEYVVSGSIATDSSIISGGRFASILINPDYVLDGYFCTDAAYISDKFYYAFIQYFTSGLKLISFDSKGDNFSEVILKLPFTNDEYLTVSEDIDFLPDYSDIEGLDLYYYNPFFDNGSVFGYCRISGTFYSDDAPTTYISEYYLINWGIDGSIESVESVELTDENLYSVVNPQFVSRDSDGNILSVTDSGVIRSSEDGNYLNTYFDCINSAYSFSLDKVVYANENLFSAIFYDGDGTGHFSLFSKSDSTTSGVTPISMYCSSLSDDLKEQIISFNNSSKDYKIGIRNYSDIYRDYNNPYPDTDILNNLALLHLEDDVLSGDIPDLIYESSGCDSVFVNRLISDNTIIDLKDSIKNDKSLNGYKYLSNIYQMDNDSVYTIIPSFTYNTYVASSVNEAISRNWTLDEYVNYKSTVDTGMIIMDSYSSTDFISKALAFNGYSWIDIAGGNATFGDDYKTYLELASILPCSYDEYSELAMTGQIPVNIHIFSTSIGNLSSDYLLAWKKVKAIPINVGFPTNTDSDRVILPSGALMICSDRIAAPGCWDFAKSFLMPEFQDSLNDSIPVLQSSYENWKKDTSYEGFAETDLVMQIDGQLFTAPQLAPDQVDLLSNMILSCDKYYFVNPAIEEIVIKNATLYFDGSVTVDEAAANTEKEVEEYFKSYLQAG